MKCLILAAGYATRLYPLTENFPKPLLDVRGKSILDWLVDDVGQASVVDEFFVVTNHKFASHFEEWAKSKPYRITVVDDGTETNETRLGAVKDVELVFDAANASDDWLVVAGDNVLDFSLLNFISYAIEKQTSCVMRYFEPSEKKLLKCGVLTIDEDDLVTDMTEKSPTPATHWCCPPFYYYSAADAKLVKEGIANGCGTDAPGSFIAWLCKRSPVYAMKMPGNRYDVGNLESYEQVKKEYRGIGK